MKEFNWTDSEHPCFQDYKFSFGEDDDPDDCDWYDGADKASTCPFKLAGGSWDTCSEGRLSHWQTWLPKEGKRE